MPSTIIDQSAAEGGSDSDTGPVWRRILSIVLAVLAVVLIVLSMAVIRAFELLAGPSQPATEDCADADA